MNTTTKQFTPEQRQKFSQWVSSLCRGRHDEWKADLLDMLLAANPRNDGNIQTVQMDTNKGNTLQLFYNNETGLVVVDLFAANEQGSNEFVRMNINEDTMLACVHKPRKSRARKIPLKLMGSQLAIDQG